MTEACACPDVLDCVASGRCALRAAGLLDLWRQLTIRPNDHEEARPMAKRYTYVKPDEEESPPDYRRTVMALSTADLEDELALGRGDAAYRAAVREELDARRRPA